MKVLFFGTPEYAVPSLAAIHASSHDVVGVVCQPDKPFGRKRVLTPPPTKVFAEEYGIPVLQPSKLREANDDIAALGADILVVIAYGKIIPESTLALSKVPPINAHASLLPAYRGAAPIERAMMAGDSETGVCVMRVVKELDAGDVMLRRVAPIPPDAMRFDMLRAMADLSAECLVDALNQLAEGDVSWEPQDHEASTYAHKLEREDGVIDWTHTAGQIYDHYRALSPVPGVHATLEVKARGKAIRMILQELHVVEDAEHTNRNGQPGVVLGADADGLLVGTKEGAVRITKIKPEGKGAMGAGDVVNGYQVAKGDSFLIQEVAHESTR